MRTTPFASGAARVVVFGVMAVATPNAQPVQTPNRLAENLQVLPRDTAGPQVQALMRRFTAALGVRCDYCHAGDAAGATAALQFADDSKPAKTVARRMMRMVQALNRDHFPADAGTRTSDEPTVECATCHRGLAKPRGLGLVLRAEHQRAGTTSALALYRSLRAQYYGSGAYDFGERVLVAVGDQFIAGGDPAAAVEYLKLNLEWNPRSGLTYFLLGEARRMLGDVASAREAYRTALEIDPANPLAKQRITELDKKQ